MAKRSGLGMNAFWRGYDLSGDIGAIDTLACPRGTYDVPGIDKSAFERIYGRKDGAANVTAYFNPAAGKAHAVFNDLPTADGDLMVLVGTALGDPAAAQRAKQLDYNAQRDASGMLQFPVATQASAGYGLEWGKMLTAGKRTDTSGTSGTGVDMITDSAVTGSTAFGLYAWLQVPAFSGTDCTIKLQESSDNGSGDAWADVTGGAFTQVTAALTTERIQTGLTATTERYLRVVTTGTFSSITFAVMAHRLEATFT